MIGIVNTNRGRQECLSYANMIKETQIKRFCRVVQKEVEFSVCCYEDARSGLKTPPRMEGCSATEECRVKGISGYEWFRCPYIGKEA